ncbi:uncharacterized protein DUF3969 [Ruminiclostridium sufflavum DSM 19573]|uniref:Uncharacterized protein DUF3969 n=1 Tax=Ruminiclostridium sufflavum DSM 19573 TaxID=1121337 RepID=A0A318XS02_9FIRM|nr:DUF3969 family protein [Ruminiclostridium sufflavum]PYG90294.1 uncharacterized protein DUF3969 [Ruminiclostridium sufflavum DSM 19573]
MKLNVSVEGKNEIERFILFLNLAMTIAIKEGVISINDAENYIYNPYSLKKLNEMGINKKVSDLIHLGCELEDIESLIPHKLSKSIEEINRQSIKLLQEIQVESNHAKEWID